MAKDSSVVTEEEGGHAGGHQGALFGGGFRSIRETGAPGKRKGLKRREHSVRDGGAWLDGFMWRTHWTIAIIPVCSLLQPDGSFQIGRELRFTKSGDLTKIS